MGGMDDHKPHTMYNVLTLAHIVLMGIYLYNGIYSYATVTDFMWYLELASVISDTLQPDS